MRFLEIAIEHYFEAKKSPDITVLELLGFAFEFAHSEKDPNSGILKELEFVRKNTTDQIRTEPGIMEIAYKKALKSNASQVTIRNVAGFMKTWKFSELVREREAAKIRIQILIARLLRQYEFRPKIGEDQYTHKLPSEG
jgi:hypothetical protein